MSIAVTVLMMLVGSAIFFVFGFLLGQLEQQKKDRPIIRDLNRELMKYRRSM